MKVFVVTAEKWGAHELEGNYVVGVFYSMEKAIAAADEVEYHPESSDEPETFVAITPQEVK